MFGAAGKSGELRSSGYINLVPALKAMRLDAAKPTEAPWMGNVGGIRDWCVANAV